MINEQVELALDSDQLQNVALKLAQSVHGTILEGGDGTRKIADFLHGTWLGHPLHPVLTDVAVGAWTLGIFFDYISLFNPGQFVQRMADNLTLAGNYAALPTILSGLIDFSTIPKQAASVAFTHAVINSVGFSLQIASSRARQNGDRERAILFSTLAIVLLTAGAYLGGHLSYAKKVGVKRTDEVTEGQEWAPALELNLIRSGEPRRIEFAGQPVLLYRKGEAIYAIGAICPHASGPLEQGTFHNGCVQCPWHDSVFALKDGSVVHGPSTYRVDSYRTRVRNGVIELRLEKHQSI